MNEEIRDLILRSAITDFKQWRGRAPSGQIWPNIPQSAAILADEYLSVIEKKILEKEEK